MSELNRYLMQAHEATRVTLLCASKANPKRGLNDIKLLVNEPDLLSNRLFVGSDFSRNNLRAMQYANGIYSNFEIDPEVTVLLPDRCMVSLSEQHTKARELEALECG